jgi:hypothetical protein
VSFFGIVFALNTFLFLLLNAYNLLKPEFAARQDRNAVTKGLIGPASLRLRRCSTSRRGTSMPRPATRHARSRSRRADGYCEPAGGVRGAAGGSGCSDPAPEPVVAGGVSGRMAVPVVAGDELLLAVWLLLFQPTITRNAINVITAMPASQFHGAPTASSRRSTGSLNRGSV